MLDKIKKLQGIEDDIQDEAISIIIESVESLIKSYVGFTDIPKELDFITLELSVRRYQRLGSEGMKSDSLDGHRIEFYELKDELVPYINILNRYIEEDDLSGRGSVMFL